jgi:SAM-dependent methyltransferase
MLSGFRDSRFSCKLVRMPGASVTAIGWDHPDTARYYEAFNRRHSRYRTANRVLIHYSSLAPGQHVLDFGAGTGGTAACALEWIGAEGRIDCVEPAAAMRAIGEGKFDDRVCWFAHLPRSSETYDRILCGAAIWQLPVLAAGLRELIERLAPGGALCFNIPAAYLGLADAPGAGRDPWLIELPAALARIAPAGCPCPLKTTPLPAPGELTRLLESCGLLVTTWSAAGRFTQSAFRDWLKIPVVGESLLGSLDAGRRATLIDEAYLQVDGKSWRRERWLGWTAWKIPGSGDQEPGPVPSFTRVKL